MRFFPRYEHFIQVDILSQGYEEHLKWQSYVETQLKRLCDQIFKDFREQLLELRIYPRPFTRAETCDTLNIDFECCESYMVGLKFSRSETGLIDLRSTVSQFCLLLDMNRINKLDNNLRIMHYRREQLAQSLVSNF